MIQPIPTIRDQYTIKGAEELRHLDWIVDEELRELDRKGAEELRELD